MIRPITPDDSASILAMAVATGMFGADETEPLARVLADYFAGALDEGHAWAVDDEAGGPIGVVYSAPAPFADGTWYVKMIAVRPDHQRRGRGEGLMRHVEDALRSGGQRVLLVETSGLPEYARARSFYEKCGYDEEARIREYYKAGEDMVVFRKALPAGSSVIDPG